MNIDQFKNERFFLLQFNEEFCWEVEENGFVVIIGEEHYEAFKQKVEARRQQPGFHFWPRGKFSELENTESTALHQGYAKEFLETAVERTLEISFAEFGVLNRTLGSDRKTEGRSLFHQQTNQYDSDKSKPRYDYVSWGYGLFYTTLMDM